MARTDWKKLYKDLCYWRAEYSIMVWIWKICPPTTICRLCKEEVEEEDFAIYTTYRRSLYTTCHKQCHDKLQKKEAYECQKIDECCNDCIFFKRYKWDRWHCTKLWRDVLSWEWIALSSDCKWEYFKHRKDI